jgi:hypothetical protein
MTRVFAWGLGLLAMALAAGGCSQPYVSGYSYYPQPATVEVLRRDGDQRSPLMVLASVLGVHNADDKQGIPYSVVVRMRFEDVGQSKVAFDPASLELVTGSLRPFERPRVIPPGPMTLSPGDRRELTAYFPFPRGVTAEQMNMRNLRLRWEVVIDSTPVIQTAVFERVDGGNDNDSEVGY